MQSMFMKKYGKERSIKKKKPSIKKSAQVLNLSSEAAIAINWN